MNQVYYVPSQQISNQLYHHTRTNSKPMENANQLKLLQERIKNSKSINIKTDQMSNIQQQKNEERQSKTKIDSSRKQNSHDLNQFSLFLNTPNIKKTKIAKPSIWVNIKQDNKSQHRDSPKTLKKFDQKTFSKDKIVLKTEPDIQFISERQINKQTSSKFSANKQSITQKEKMKQICQQIKPLKQFYEETKNINSQQEQTSKDDKNQEKILDLLLLSTRELKFKFGEKQILQTQAPLTKKVGLPADFFFQKI